MSQSTELGHDSRLGDLVCWETLAGVCHEGRLVEWDNGTAIVRLPDGREVAVQG